MPPIPSSRQPSVNSQRLLIGFLVVVLGLYVAWKSSQQPAAKPEPATVEKTEPTTPPETPPETSPESAPSQSRGVKVPAAAASTKKLQTKIPSVTVRDQDDKVVFRGTVDVGPTLARIERGEKLRFPNDGTVFQNREQRLPRKPAGYYREYVHPTAKVGGPGPQRIVKGKAGEVFYTHDHYHTFLRLDQP
ncbi:MAG: ribonuclease domain-containing protein [Pirellulaceae bacterium]